MTNKDLIIHAKECATYDIPYSVEILLKEMAYKLAVAEEDIERSCRTCWYKHNDRTYEQDCMNCVMNWDSLGEKTGWKWRYND